MDNIKPNELLKQLSDLCYQINFLEQSGQKVKQIDGALRESRANLVKLAEQEKYGISILQNGVIHFTNNTLLNI